MLLLLFSWILQRFLQGNQQRRDAQDQNEFEILDGRLFWANQPRIRYVRFLLDRYGPFWLYTTMVFVSTAVHNVLIYQSNSNTFSYDYKAIGVSLSIFYIMGMILSAVIGLFFGCMGLASKTSQIVCLYGYSMSTYVICVLLCIINMSLTTWLFLIYGACTKVAFVLKNVF